MTPTQALREALASAMASSQAGVLDAATISKLAQLDAAIRVGPLCYIDWVAGVLRVLAAVAPDPATAVYVQFPLVGAHLSSVLCSMLCVLCDHPDPVVADELCLRLGWVVEAGIAVGKHAPDDVRLMQSIEIVLDRWATSGGAPDVPMRALAVLHTTLLVYLPPATDCTAQTLIGFRPKFRVFADGVLAETVLRVAATYWAFPLVARMAFQVLAVLQHDEASFVALCNVATVTQLNVAWDNARSDRALTLAAAVVLFQMATGMTVDVNVPLPAIAEHDSLSLVATVLARSTEYILETYTTDRDVTMLVLSTWVECFMCDEWDRLLFANGVGGRLLVHTLRQLHYFQQDPSIMQAGCSVLATLTGDCMVHAYSLPVLVRHGGVPLVLRCLTRHSTAPRVVREGLELLETLLSASPTFFEEGSSTDLASQLGRLALNGEADQSSPQTGTIGAYTRGRLVDDVRYWLQTTGSLIMQHMDHDKYRTDGNTSPSWDAVLRLLTAVRRFCEEV